jgi:5,5'-dehydrodivanillate O-demethylase
MAIAEQRESTEVPGASRRRYRADLTSTGPGTPGGIFLRQFWHAIGRRAVPLRIMSEDYTLVRGTTGRVQVFPQRCPHRGALLHQGWVEGDTLRCVYHGWTFDGSGQCVEAPAEREGFERNVCIRTHPAAEAFGLIYAFFGEGEPPEFPPYPESHGDGVIDNWATERVPCNYLQSFENSMDEVHVAFTHSPGGSHAALSRDLPLISAEETDWGMLRLGKRRNGMTRHTLHYAPNIVRVAVPPPAGMDGVGGWPEMTFHFTPIDDDNHLWVFTIKVPVTGADADRYWAKRAECVAKRAAAPPLDALARDMIDGNLVYADVRHPDLAILQDIAVQAGQGRIADREHEILGRSDAGIAVWRRILEREIEIIAAGGTPKRWSRPPDDVHPVLGIEQPA